MFISRLKNARKEAGLSQRELAALLYISQQAYAKYEVGSATPSPDTLARIADHLGVSVDYLLGRSTCPNELKENPPTPVLPIDEQEVLEAWREATDPARESALMVLQCNKRPQS